MNKLSYPIADLGVLKPLMQKFVEKDPELLPFISQYASLEAYAKQIKEKSTFAMDRDLLADDVLDQYGAIALSKQTKENIEKLREKTTFTVVTGHQPCLFTGPMYFIIKILQTIKLADELNKHYADTTIVPVYWMGAEDHDFEEINHFNLFNKTLTWKSNEEGSVGRFDTKGLESVLAELKEVLGDGKHESELITLFEDAYLKHENYGEATRYLVNALFGDRGLVIVEGDRPKLKACFKDIMAKELESNLAYKAVNKQIKPLEKYGKIQVNPREINLFYLDRLGRNRIIADVNGLSIDGRKGIRNTEEVVEELLNKPRKFSPNVLLRPVYQETILPNLAYIGGPGELAYWLELKELFVEVDLPMPLLVLRNSFVFITERHKENLEKLELEVRDLFLEESEWVKKLVKEQADEVLTFDREHAIIMKAVDDMKQKAEAVDPTLVQVFEGEKARLDKSLENLEKRVFKAEKRKNDVTLNQVKRIQDRLFPGGVLQERKENFAGFYVVEGSMFIERIYDRIDPLEARMNVMVV